MFEYIAFSVWNGVDQFYPRFTFGSVAHRDAGPPRYLAALPSLIRCDLVASNDYLFNSFCRTGTTSSEAWCPPTSIVAYSYHLSGGKSA